MREFQFRYVRSQLEWVVFPWVEWHSMDLPLQGRHGTGLFFTATVPVAILAAAAGAFIDPGRRCLLLSLLCGGGLFLLGWWFMNAREPRYAVGAVVLLIPLVAWTISRAKGIFRNYYDKLVAATVFFMLFKISTVIGVEFGDRIIFSKQYTRASFYNYPEDIDRLPPDSRILNLAAREANYLLYGKYRRNNVVSHLDTLNRYVVNGPLNEDQAEKESEITLNATKLRENAVTHIFSAGLPSLFFNGCAVAREIGRIEFNPINGVRIPRPFALYEVSYCESPAQVRHSQAFPN